LGEYPEDEPEELRPAPNDEPLPEYVDKVARHGILVGGGKKGDDPGDDVTLGSDGLSLEVLADLWVEYCQQSFELIHFNLEHFELIDEDLFESVLHQVLKNTVGILLVFSLDVEIPCEIVHTLTVGNFNMEVSIRS